MEFDKSGETFFVTFWHRPSERQSVCRNTSDGREVSPSERKPPRPKYVLEGGVSFFSKAARTINPWLVRLGVKELEVRANVFRVVDMATSRTVGTHYVDGPHERMMAADESGFVEQKQPHATRIDYYRLPPPMNWGWLVRWVLIPPALIWMLETSYRRFRGRRSDVGASRGMGQATVGQSAASAATLTSGA
jgi:hypothetical protein